MKDYRNMRCAACGVVFDEESDIVVCPECGAPHHRECWKAEGHCACENEHDKGYTWEPEKVVIGGEDKQKNDDAQNSSEQSQAEEKIICPVCGKETLKSNKYCERCGYDLAHGRDGAYSDGTSPNFGGAMDFNSIFNLDESELINGVPAGDVKKFVGNMWVYYIPKFLTFVRKKTSVSFNFTACITHGLWFISRKMYGIGIALVAVMLGITGYQLYFYDLLYSTFGSALSKITAYDLLNGNKMLFFGALLYSAMSFLELLIMLLCGIFGNKLYMGFCTKKIKKINAKATACNATADQFNETLESEGGVAVLQACSIGICYFVILYVLESGVLF